jgi:hypothetical protein
MKSKLQKSERNHGATGKISVTIYVQQQSISCNSCAPEETQTDDIPQVLYEKNNIFIASYTEEETRFSKWNKTKPPILMDSRLSSTRTYKISVRAICLLYYQGAKGHNI